MERSTIFNGKNHELNGPFSMAMLNNQRVISSNPHLRAANTPGQETPTTHPWPYGSRSRATWRFRGFVTNNRQRLWNQTTVYHATVYWQVLQWYGSKINIPNVGVLEGATIPNHSNGIAMNTPGHYHTRVFEALLNPSISKRYFAGEPA